MSMLDVLEACRERGIQLALKNGGLLLRDPQGKLDPVLREQLAVHKAAIMQWLAAPSGGDAPIPHAPRDGRLPLSFAQQRLWLVSALDASADRAYHLPSALRLSGSVHRDALRQALDGLIARHESLRTRFVAEGGVPHQLVMPAGQGFALHEEDAASPDAVAQAIADELATPFDLANGPLIRGRLLRVSEQDHVLVLNQHHIVSDGWSNAVMVRELAALYRAACQGEPDGLAPLPIQYADYAHWQRQMLQGPVLAQQLDFWRGHLAGAPELLELPLDRPRAPTPSHAGGQWALTVPAPLTEGLRALAQRRGATLYMVLMAAWSLLLSRLSGQSTVVVATPVAGRHRRELEGLIGFFVNTLAFCTRVEEGQSVTQLIEAVRRETLAAFAHQELPFEQVVEALRPTRSLSHVPLAQASFTWHNEPEGGTVDLPQLSLAALPLPHQTTQFDLSLHLSDAGACLEGTLIHASDLFDEATVARWSRCFLCLLEGFVADEAQEALRVPLLPEADYRQVVDAFNVVPPALPPSWLAHACFEGWVDARGDAIALEFDGESLSYGELDERANRLAHYLLAQGAQPDGRVALCVERGVEYLVGVLGILKAGCAYVPLDPEYPPARLSYMVNDSAPLLVLTQSSVAEQLPPLDVPVLRLDVDLPVLARRLPATRPAVPALQASHLAYLIYTSGSTGEPKAVMVEHRQLCHLAASQAAVFGDLAGSRVLQFASPSFDASVWEWAMALLSGGTLCLAPRHRLLPGEPLLATLRDQAITHATLPGSALQTLGEAELPHLRTLVVAGEACPVALAERWRERLSFFNAYGPTEGTVCASIERCREEHDRTVPIGRPLPNTKLHVLDGRGEVVPVGVVGEIYLGGAGVTRGYLGREALTAERFVADRIGGVAGERLYRTGDLGRYRADGRLECLGRVDFQVKLRGHRIEIGEIETQLEALPGVGEAAVLLLGEGAEARLVAYWTAAAGEEEESAASLRAQLASRLPDYMLPSSLVAMAHLPRTGNGKLDRAALPTTQSGAVAQREYEAPQGEVEETLARLWQELLDVPRVGRHDHFFELGGHSLLAVQLASRLRDARGVDMPLRLLFGTPTLAALAAALPAADATAPPEPALVPVARDRRLPLSLAQQRLWFVERFDRQASLSYHLPLALRLTGALDVDALKASLSRIWERHEVLRCFFPDDGGVPYLDFLDRSFVLPEQDLSTLPGDARSAAFDEIALHEARTPFDFTRGPLIRARLLRLDSDDHVLLVTMHHVISDGWSMAVLVRELGALYPAFRMGHSDPLPPLPVQYADYALWQRERMQGERLERDMAFWREHLSGAPSLIDLPLDRSRPPIQDHRGDFVLFDCPADLARDLRAFAERHGATLYMVLMAGWAIALSRITGQDDLVIGTPVAGRQRREVEDLIGFFVNTLALRVRVESSATVAAIVAAVKETALSAFAHQDLPFEQVVEAVQPERSLSHAALAQVSFTWHNEPTGGTLALPGLTLAPIEQAMVDTHFDLSLHLTDVGDRLSGQIIYAAALFERGTVERVSELLVQVLHCMIMADATAAGTLSLLSAEQRQALAQAESHPVVQRVRGERVHRRFEAWAMSQPEAPALSLAGEVLSYGALNARANALAHHLRSQGLAPDQRVAIVAERSFEFVVAVLAVLKAGGAYVPLDPALPRARLAHILAECGPSALLIQSEAEDVLPSLDIPVLRLDTDLPLLARRLPQTDLADDPDAGEHDLCYVIYTSGSTGTPKGVMVEHPSVLNMALAHGEWLGLSPRDRVLQFAALSFDVCAADLFMSLAHGACLQLAGREELQPGGPLERTLREQRVSVVMLPVAALAACVHDDLPELRCLVVGGDVCPPALAERWRVGRRLFNVYGPTEGTVAASAHECTGEPMARLPIGRALNNARLYVLDQRQQPVPTGVVGEICIGGAGIARGYLGRPEETAARFLADPFHADATARMYRTGDLGRWRADGTLDFLGRRDQQVKIRGFRIELGEIEGHLLACEGVREAAVAVHERGGQRQLVAYVTALDGVEPGVAGLRARLAGHLPDYMQPSVYLFVDSLPLTANGKLDRSALPMPQADDWGRRAYEAPQGGIEQVVARVWQDLLDQPQISRHDHFFELGGHSLLVVALVERLREQGLIGEVRAIFGAPTLAEYAAGLRPVEAADEGEQDAFIPPGTTHLSPEMLTLVTLSQGEIDRVVASIPGGVANIKDVYPLVPLQEGMLFHHLLETKGDTYLSRSQVAFESKDLLDRFLAALDEVIQRHDILRCAFLWEGMPQPIQVVQREASLPVHALQVEAGEDAAAILDARTDPRHIQIDLRRAPLLAAYIVEDRERNEWLLSLLYHHILGDRTASELVRTELGKRLQAGWSEPSPSPSLRALIKQASSVPPAQYEAYFRKVLAGIDEPTAPFGILDTRQTSSDLLTVQRQLPDSLAAALRECARVAHVSTTTLFHVAFARVLGACTARDDVVFGTVLSGRMQGAEGADRAVGMFINNLPVRFSLRGISVAQALQDAYRQLLELLAYEQTPLAVAQRCSDVPPTLPLFTAMFNYRHSRGTAAIGSMLPVVDGIRVLGTEDGVNYPLSMSVDDNGRDFTLTAQCVAGIDGEAICGYLEHVLASMASALGSSATERLDALPLMTSAQRDRVLFDFNATSVEYPRESLIHELFEQRAAESPDAVAVMDEHRMLTYAELNARANRIAHYLIAQGVRPDERVALCCERSAELIIGLLGILKAGGAYVPLDAEYPPERLAFMLEDSAPKRLLLQSGLRERLPASAVPQLVLDDSEATLAAYPDHNPDARAHGASSRQLAYVIYTSGSTGTPKGVMVEHRQVLRLVMQDRYAPLCAADGVALCANPAFDAATWEIWATLLHGARLIVITPACLLDVAALGETLHRHQATVLHLTAGLFHQYADALGPVFARLNYLLFGGDRIDADVVRRVLKGARPAHLVHCYGPTETTTFASTHEIVELDAQARSVPIGRPIGNTRIYVLDACGEPVPVGVTGEIHIGGDGVARGYLNRAELTAERFMRDPFSADAQARMYRTGDLGRWGEDGTLEFQGRNDFQVKIRGFRIELGEIEAKLAACAGVREAVVLAREDVPGDKRLVAYWVAEAAAQISAAELRQQLSAQLPEYMVPSALVMLEAFPLTPNGKLDRRALPAPDGASLSVREYEAPDGEVEEALAGIWRELLQVERIGRHDHFFELGGHSLLVVAMTARLRAQGLRGEVQALFAVPVLSGYAATLRRGEEAEAEAIPPSLLTPDILSISPELLPLVTLTQAEIDCVVATVPGGVANVQDIYPLLPSQQGILFHHMLDREGDTYLLRALLAFDSREELDDFLRALDAVVARHDILRTAVVWEGLSTPVQVVHRQARVPVRELALPDEGDALEALAGLTDPRRLRLDLTRAPLLAAYIAEDRAGGWMLSMLQHHLVCDHVTLALALVEIDAICRGNGADLADEVPMRQLVAQALRVPAAKHEAYFRQELAHIDEPTAPFNALNARQSGATFETVKLPLDESLGREIRAEARRRGVSPAVLFHVAWAQVLARCTGRNEVVFGTVLSGRMYGVGGADRAWGMFINTLPIRVVVEGTAADAVEQTRRRLAELLEHEHAPLSLAQRCSSVPSSLPLFTALLNYRHDGDLSAMPVGMRLIASEETTNYPISVDVDDFGDRFVLTTQVVDDLGAARLAGYLAHAIACLTAELRRDGTHPLHALDVLPPPERDLVLFDFNATSAEYPQESLIHELFEQQAAAQPDALAVVYEGRHLTYGELNARANQVAHYLLSQGVKPDDRVAICVERSLEMVVGLLGILKAGGAYVPLDPDYPAERLAYMLEDSAPVALLTQATLEERLPVCGAPTLRLDTSGAQALLAAQPTHNPEPRAHGLTSRHLAYVIYTSGSTGMPKGVMVEHLSATNLIVSHSSCCELVASDKVLQFASFAFDASVEEIFPALCVGASIVVRPAKLSLDSESFSEYLDRYGVTVAELPTAFWHLWAQTVDVIKCRSLRLVVVGGEKAERRALQAWNSAGGITNRRWLNTYGPTESTVYSAAIVFDEATPFPVNEIPIGRPIANTRMYILDAQGEPVPVGVAGELYIGGAGVARGYLNRPELTAERFVRDPFHADPQARIYRTGDLGRWLPDGNIEYLGRNDFQVKIRGFRIEPGEIEARLAACAGVREAVVLAREDEPGDKRLVAYLTADAGADLSIAELRTRLSVQLPDYMVPSAFMVLDAFPLTPNGKLDRKALPAPDGTSLTRREYEAPQGEIEQGLAEIWQSLLKVGQVGRHDHFFELGGHSLLAVQMTSQARERLGVELALRELFLHPTLFALAARIKAHFSTRTWSPLVPLKDTPGKPMLYMVPGVAMTAGSFWDLAQSLDGRMNVHVLEAWGLEEGQNPCTRMEDIVEMNLSAMRESGLPDGPIVLGGHSFGGSVAFELARALEAAGHRVQLMLIDNLLMLPKYLRWMTNPKLHDNLGTDERLKKLFDAQCDIYKRYKPSGRFHGAVEVIYARDGEIKSMREKERLHACRKYCEQQPVVSWVAGDHRSMLGAAHADELSEAIWQAWRRHIDRSEGFTR